MEDLGSPKVYSLDQVVREDRTKIGVRERLARGGFLQVPAGQKLYGVMVGDTVRVISSVGYKGPALDTTYRAAIGDVIAGVFDEVWYREIAVHFDASPTNYTPYTLTADIPITEVSVLPWTPGWHDLYTKIGGLIPYVISPFLLDIIEVVVKPQFENFKIVSYDKIAGA